MGIPSYFSYIIQNYSNIIRNYDSLKTQSFGYLFMDCNSIIYDAFRDIEINDPHLLHNTNSLETELITRVVSRIHEYVCYIKPTELLYIAFDGVAPFAKMDQQRIRRHKNSESTSSSWSTSNITPGTHFMNQLSKKVKKSFMGLETHYRVKNIYVTAADEPGEGEHKMFQYIRDRVKNAKNELCAVYGLDSDLIMLSLFHCSFFKQLFIFRETPAFGKHMFPEDVELNDNECHFLDIPLLASRIVHELKCKDMDPHRIYDYVFMCFFLGNDFLPHFPSLNIRTNGTDVLLTTYSKMCGNFHEKFLVSKSLEIEWKNVNKFIYELAKYEQERFLGESTIRKKWGKRNWKTETDDDLDFLKQSVPVIYRSEELYIEPSQPYWQNRYYNCLFGENVDRKTVCRNYLEGLEWVFRYYTQNCPHWRWRYAFSYPPLLKDLVTYVPRSNVSFLNSDTTSNKPFASAIQLCYVLPKHQHSLLEPKYRQLFQSKFHECFTEKLDYHWAYCRYLWEAHPILPQISLATLNQWETI
jgi:5'-3' exonuclease